MKTSFRKAALRVALAVSAVWLLVNAFIPRDPYSQSEAEIESLIRRASTIQQPELSRAELAQLMPALHVPLSCNRYHPEVRYFSPDNWLVRLVPDRKMSFSNPRPWTYRLLFLDLRTTSFPVIEIRSLGSDNKTPIFAEPAH